MKKILCFSLMLSLALSSISCNEHKNSTTTNDAKEDNTSFQTDTIKAVQSQENPKEIIDPNAPPKYETKAIAVEVLLSRLDTLEVRLTKEQINKINDIAENLNVTTFKNQYSYSRFRRRMVRIIKSEVLTPEQLQQWEDLKRKNNATF